MSSTDSLSSFSTCEISDALIKLGIKSGGYLADITMLSPARDDTNVKICGPAYTVKMVPASDKSSPKPDVHFVDSAPAESVIVISAPPAVKSAVWGGLMTAGAQSRAAVGVVIDGRCRDISEHRDAKFPVFAKATSTLGQGGFTRPSALNVSVDIEGAMEGLTVTVGPGDIVVGDVDGVVCVPAGLVAGVLEKCRIGRSVDAKCMESIRAGKGVAASFLEYRGR